MSFLCAPILCLKFCMIEVDACYTKVSFCIEYKSPAWIFYALVICSEVSFVVPSVDSGNA